MTKIGKKLAAVLLAVAMVVTFVPVLGTSTTYASEGPMRLTFGPSALMRSCNVIDAFIVRYGDNGNYAWRVIGYDVNGAWSSDNEGKLTLLSADTMGETKFSDSNCNEYGKSLLKVKIDEIASHLSEGEQSAVVKRTLLSGEYNHQVPTEVDCISGETVADAIMWPLSIKEVGGVNGTLRTNVSVTDWWLRSQGHQSINGTIFYKKSDGYASTQVDNTYGIRPAFYLNLDSILFTAPAQNGKQSGPEGADALFENKQLTGNEYKLTVKDDSHKNFKVNSFNVNDSNTLTAEYSGAIIGDNEFISAVIKHDYGSGDEVVYYGRIQKVKTAKGTVSINLSGKCSDGDTVCIFNEQYNGDNKTDYASELVELNPKAIDLTNAKVSLSATAFTYNGQVQIPSIKTIGGETLKEGTDYTAVWSNASSKNVGTYTVTITGKDDYTGTTKATYKINKKAVTPTVTLSASAYTWNGKVRKPAVTVKDGSTKLAASDYTVTYKNNKNVGKASAVVTLKGNYSGSKTVTFKINPKGTSLKTLTKASKAVTVKWTKQATKMSSARITGYQIQYATDSKFTKNAKTVTVKGYSTVSRKITKLTGGKKYYVRIRTYMKTGGANYYSPWSKAKTVTTKK